MRLRINSWAGGKMPKRSKERSLIEFQKEFPDNEACAKHIAEQRWPGGFICPQCGHKEAWYLSKRYLFDCIICRFQTSVTAGKLLPWIHRVISNAKAVIRGAHRGVSEKHLQASLSEICYRFNRRFWEKQLFDRLVKACISSETITHEQLVSGG
jgi:predicted RNA-binding Zn-ribbon protein involved in translation (DUF1610 family)